MIRAVDGVLVQGMVLFTCPGDCARATAKQAPERSAGTVRTDVLCLRVPASVSNVKNNARGCGLLSVVLCGGGLGARCAGPQAGKLAPHAKAARSAA